MSKKLLDINELTVSYETDSKKITAVSNASLSVGQGEYVGVVGESGCGKSTIADAIIRGIDDNGSIESGEILFKGENILEMDAKRFNKEFRWNEISWIPQGSMNSLDPVKTIHEQASIIAKQSTDNPQDHIDNLYNIFEHIGFPEDRIDDYPHQLSGGMQQRVLIAFAFFLNPSIVIADEPTTALDVLVQDQIIQYINKLKEELGLSMLLITHDISLVLENCNKMVVMHSGQVAESGPTTTIHDSPKHPYTIMLQGAFPDLRHPSQDLEVIKGHPPQMTGRVNYCTFKDRCPISEKKCEQSEPKLEKADEKKGSHRAACFKKDKVHKINDE